MLRSMVLAFATGGTLCAASACAGEGRDHADAYARDEGASTPWLAMEVRTASSDPGSDAGMDAARGIPCPVELVLRTRCRVCHDASPLAPPPAFLAVEDFSESSFTAPLRSVAEVAYDRVRALDQARMPPLVGEPLTADELATMRDWLGEGAPAGGGCAPSLDAEPEVPPEAARDEPAASTQGTLPPPP